MNRYFTSAKAKEAILPDKEEEKQAALIPEERLKEIINILLPYGYSHYDKSKYTGVSPFIGSTKNVITIVANEKGWGSVFSICMESFTEDEDEENSLGYYKGIMKLIAPELVSTDDSFKGVLNVLDFRLADNNVQDNAFPAEVKLKKKDD